MMCDHEPTPFGGGERGGKSVTDSNIEKGVESTGTLAFLRSKTASQLLPGCRYLSVCVICVCAQNSSFILRANVFIKYVC